MKRYLAAAFAALVIGSGAVTTVLSQADPAPTRLGFIDIRKAFETYRKRKDVMEQVKTKSDAFVAQLKQRTAQIEQMAEKLNTMNAGTDEYAALDRQIAVEKYAIDVDKKQKGRELDTEQRKKNALIYKEICQEAQTLGQERGLAAVLLYIPPDTDFDQDLDLIVSTRAVLCRDDQLDVTQEVVTRLNAQLPPPPVVPAKSPDDASKPPK